MFEIKKPKGAAMELMIGSWVDVIEFAKRWESFSEVEKNILLKITEFRGTYHDLADEIDYESKYANHEWFDIKFAVTHLVQLGLLEVDKNTSTFTVKNMTEVINKILEI